MSRQSTLTLTVVSCVLLVSTGVSAQVCQPSADGFGCRPQACSAIPDEQCVGTVLHLDIATGAVTTLACGCMDPIMCHVEFGDASPMAVGECPDGAPCHVVAYDTDGDGRRRHVHRRMLAARRVLCRHRRRPGALRHLRQRERRGVRGTGRRLPRCQHGLCRRAGVLPQFRRIGGLCRPQSALLPGFERPPARARLELCGQSLPANLRRPRPDSMPRQQRLLQVSPRDMRRRERLRYVHALSPRGAPTSGTRCAVATA